MSDDLVERLRLIGEKRLQCTACYKFIDTADEAADRIEHLEAALREIAADFGTVSAVGTMDALYSAAAILAERINIARKTLEGEDE